MLEIVYLFIFALRPLESPVVEEDDEIPAEGMLQWTVYTGWKGVRARKKRLIDPRSDYVGELLLLSARIIIWEKEPSGIWVCD